MVDKHRPGTAFSIRRVAAAVGLIVAFAAGVAAQTSTGGIRGIVRDGTGAILAGVTVEATSPSLIGGASVEVTNQQGQYVFDRLPIGTYKFTFTLQGFKTVAQEGVRVEVGRTIDLDAAMEVGTVEETLTVSAAAPVVDSLHAGTSTNFSQQLLEEIPSARVSWFNTVGFAPAVRADLENFGGATFLLYGSASDQNSYQFEGIDYNAPSGSTMWDRPNPDSIAEVQLKSIGASAEETGFQGGIVNEIMRSATSRWKGKISYFYIGDKLTGNNTPAAQYPFRIGYLSDVTVEYGGPIIKDRLWLNGMFEQFNNHQVQVGVPLDLGPTTRRTKPTFKLNMRLSSHDVVDFAYTDSYHNAAPQTSVLQPTITTSGDMGHNPIFAAHWTRTIGTRTVFEAKGGGIWEPDQNGPPRSGDFTTPGHFDIGTGRFTVNTRSANTTRFRNHSAAATVTHYTDKFIAGSHDLKFGVQAVPSALGLSGNAWLNNMFFYDLNGQPFYVLVRQPQTSVGEVKSAAGFVQDYWTVTNRVTWNVGIRYDHTTGSVPESDAYNARSEKTGERYSGTPGNLVVFDNVSPRLGFTVKLDSRGKTVAKTSWGRYYGRLSTSMFSTISPGNTVSNYFNFNPATGKYDIPFRSVDPRGNYGIDPDLKNQYTDQFFIGIERQIMSGLGVDLAFVAKKEHDFIRVRDVSGVYVAQPFVDTFGGFTQTLTVYNRTSPSSQSLYQTTNRNDFKQEYRSVVAQVNKRMSSFWQLLGSYQWERSLGNNTGAISIGSQTFSNTGPSGFGADPNDLTNSYGPFYTNNTHTVRINGAFQLPLGFNVGVQESFESGRPYGRIVTVRGLGQGARSVLAEPRGAYRLGSTNNLQLRLGKDFKAREGQRLRLSLDVYNIFNADSALTVQNNSTQTAVPFATTLAVFTPRRAQVGIRYEF